MGDSPDLQHTRHHHDCCRCTQSQEGRCQAQGPRCPPPLRRHDQGCHQGPRRQEGLLPSGHPEVHLRQLQGGRCQGWRTGQARPEEAGHLQGYRRCCCRWQEGSWIIQARREAKGRQTRQKICDSKEKGCQTCCQETSCQEGQESCSKEEVNNDTSQSFRKIPFNSRPF